MVVTKLLCKSCNRYLCDAINNVRLDNLICATCKRRNTFNIKVKKGAAND